MIARSLKKEILDETVLPRDEHLMVVRRLAWFNVVFGNDWLVYYFVRKLVGSRISASILDVGTGIADLPRYLVRRFRERGMVAQITGIDISAQVIDLTLVDVGQNRAITLDTTALVDTVGEYDIVIASQMLHHLTPAEAVEFFRTAYEKAAVGVVVSDLIRSRFNYWLVKLMMYVTFTDKYNRHDGPLSVLRAYTSSEIREMLGQAGISNFKIYNFLFRKIIIISKR